MTQPSINMTPLCTLCDKLGDSDMAVPVTVTADSDWLAIRPHGYGEAEAMDGHGDPILLEVWQGELRLLIGTDINDPEKSVISLDGAREDFRCDERPREMSSLRTRPVRREHSRQTVSLITVGSGHAGALALQLLAHSLWFRCTPLPDDEYEFAIPAEHADWFRIR